MSASVLLREQRSQGATEGQREGATAGTSGGQGAGKGIKAFSVHSRLQRHARIVAVEARRQERAESP